MARIGVQKRVSWAREQQIAASKRMRPKVSLPREDPKPLPQPTVQIAELPIPKTCPTLRPCHNAAPGTYEFKFNGQTFIVKIAPAPEHAADLERIAVAVEGILTLAGPGTDRVRLSNGQCERNGQPWQCQDHPRLLSLWHLIGQLCKITEWLRIEKNR